MRSIMHNQSGQLAMQIALVAAITGAVVLSAISTLNRVSKGDAQVQMTEKFLEIRNRITAKINNDKAWTNTLNAAENTGITCIRDKTDCNTGTDYTTANTEFVIYDENNNIWYKGTTAATSWGFTEDGEVCCDAADGDCTGQNEGYDSGTGLDTCPVQATTTWQATRCKTGGDTDCDVSVSVAFTYNAASRERDFKFNVDEVSGRLSNTFVRGSKAAAGEYFMLVDAQTAPADGGQCATNNDWNDRNLTRIEVDTGSNVTMTENSTNVPFTLTAGTYECSIEVPSAMSGGHQARLITNDEATTHLFGTTGYKYNSSMIVGRFTIAAATALKIQHFCEGTDRTTTDFGYASPDATATEEIFSVVRCNKISN